MLDDSTREYINRFFWHLKNERERAADRHYSTTWQNEHKAKLIKDSDFIPPADFFEKEGLSEDPEILALLENGIEQFRKNTAERIFRDNADKIFFNNCPQCGKLARTPEAKQCRYCGYSWHGKNLETGKYKEVGKFKIAGAFQIIDGLFYIVGDVLSGEVKKGMKVNLTVLSLTIKPDITDVESIAYRGDGNLRQATVLAISIKSEADKEFLKTKSPFEQPVPIEE
jgi:hypothetical protein